MIRQILIRRYGLKLAEIIEKGYDDFDGFVILHGTDTMAYTASALSFMLENLANLLFLPAHSCQ